MLTSAIYSLDIMHVFTQRIYSCNYQTKDLFSFPGPIFPVFVLSTGICRLHSLHI